MNDTSHSEEPHPADEGPGETPPPAEHEYEVRAGASPHGEEEVDWKKTGIAAAGIVGVALLLAAGLVITKKQPPRKPAQAEQIGVRVALAKQRDVKPVLVAYGRARPSRYAIISAQVGGLAKMVNTDLKGGSTLPAGALVVQIDDADHQAEAQRLGAQVDAAHAEIERLEAQIASVGSRLVVASELLAVEEKNLARTRAQFDEGVRNDREVESARLLVLRARDAQLSLEASRDQLGPQLRAAQARLVEAQARHRLAEIDLERTRITLPYAGQISNVQIEQHQLLKPNQQLFVLSDGSRMEVPAPLSMSDALLLARELDQTPKGSPDEAERVVVEAEAGGASYRWSGVLVRFEPVDGETQTVKAVIEVENAPGHMPLLNDVFCRVTLQAAAHVSGLMIPEEAVQERDMVYVLRDGKLAIVEPRLGRRVGAWVLVEEGLDPDEQVIVSPLERVVEGTPLTVTEVVEPGSSQ